MAEPRKPLSSLSVINPNDKVEQLRRAFVADGGAVAAPRPAGDSILDPSVEQDGLCGEIVDALRTVFDPEIPVNVYDLGLIYAIDADAENRFTIRMTLTAPACPVAGDIIADVEKKVRAVPGVASARVDLVFEPAWTKARMSEAALLELGML